MESNQMKLLCKTLNDIKHQNSTEYWYARELFPILGYTRWESFETPIDKAKEACKNVESDVHYHFQDSPKMVKIGLDLEKSIPDIKLTRYACYLIAINGNPRKEEIAFAQAYFVSQTTKIEVLEQKMHELERIDSRDKLKITEKEFGVVVFSRGVDGRGLGEIKSFGDHALFGGKTTDDMKKKLNLPVKKPLADFLPNVTLKAKDLSMAMTTENTRQKNLRGKGQILNEHVNNNRSVRTALTSSNIYPENLPATEDIKKIEAKHRKEIKELEKRQKQELDQATKKLKS